MCHRLAECNLVAMTYSQKELNESLNRLALKNRDHYGRPNTPLDRMALSQLHVALEVESFLDRSREHAERSRTVSVGRY